jgi:hypothetical protein
MNVVAVSMEGPYVLRSTLTNGTAQCTSRKVQGEVRVVCWCVQSKKNWSSSICKYFYIIFVIN